MLHSYFEIDVSQVLDYALRFKLSLELPRNQRRQADESAQASDDVEALKLNRALVAA